MTDSTSLRLSAMRAFFGRIYPEMRLIKVERVENRIDVVVLVGVTPPNHIRDAVSRAAAEIIADFPDAQLIKEHQIVEPGPIPSEDCIARGWIYRGADP